MAQPTALCRVRQIMVSASVIFGAHVEAASSSSIIIASPPAEFGEVDTRRPLVVDIYLRGQKFGQAPVTIEAGKVQFEDAQSVASRLPDLTDHRRILDWLSMPLDGNFDQACGLRRTEECTLAAPDELAIVMDEDRFRIDLLIPATFFKRPPRAPLYLPGPTSGVSFISRFGAAIAGGAGGDTSYHLQNHSILAAGSYRLRADSSMLSRNKMAFDNLAVERDLKDHRWLSGLFWAPGGNFLGRRKMVGIGFASQIDTRLDRRALTAEPLNVVLSQSARIDLFIDGRLMSSKSYAAGSVEVDTTPLPEGSYEVVLKIHEAGRGAREDRRFFSKGAEIAPLGRPQWGAFAGVLADRRGRPELSAPFFQLSAAARLAPGLGADARIFGTNAKILAELGGVAITPLAKLRGSVLISSSGDYGLLARAMTTGQGRFSASFDLRTVKSQNGHPLLPESGSFGTFSEESDFRTGDRGTYTQGSLYLAATFGSAFARLTGHYRKSAGAKAGYSIGASVEQPVTRGPAWHVVANADIRKTERDTAVFVGLRALLAGPTFSVAAAGGWQHQRGRAPQFVGETQANLSGSVSESAEFSTSGAIGRDLSGAYGRASGLFRTSDMNLRGDLLHGLGGDDLSYFSAAVDTAFVFDGGQLTLGAQNVADSAIVISPRTASDDQHVEVLVDESLRGQASVRRPLLLFLKPYELHRVRIRPTGSSTSNYDSAERMVATYPGKVTSLSWIMVRTASVFGRALDEQNQPIARARIESSREVGQSDDEGYFQIEAAVGERLLVKSKGGSCQLDAVLDAADQTYVDVGVQICR